LLRLAFLTELYFPNIGGQEVFFQELAEALVKRGHSVDVYCIRHDAALPATETLNGVQVHRLSGSDRYTRPLVPQLRRDWFAVLRYCAAVRRHLSRQTYDFYLLNQWPLLHVAALPGQIRARSGIHWCEIRQGWLMRTVQQRLPRMVGSNFAISQPVGTAITEQSQQPCSILPSGVDRSRYRVGERQERSGVLYVGRLAAHKNLPLLIDAFQLAAAAGFSGDLVIAGDGPDRAEIEAYAQRSPVAARIHLLGSVSEERKINLLSEAALLGMPSRREGFPRVIAEAMASGLPTVTASFAANGSKEVVTQFGAGIVCDTDPTAFAEALLAAEAGWDEFSRAGLAGAQSLDWSGIADTLEDRADKLAPKC
jgi:glycosyltransferase involved in cell wall biosynthesis